MLQLQNTMTRQKEPFEPRSGRTVKLFTCGPSIYRPPHIGNYRTFLWEDVLQRYLEYRGYGVRRVINFTDVEDKAIEEAQALGLSLDKVTGAVAERFLREAGNFRIKLPEKIPRSSTSVKQAVYLIRKLLRKGYAYWHEGDVFFDPLKFEGFGKLFRLDMSKWPKKKRRFKRDTYPGQRWNLGDFVLWHGYREGDGVYWDTGLGKGRPSWNIQDPAMISESLGYRLDIFCGGIDNLWRHHDYNIAVMEAASGEELARYWLHGQHVLVGGKKMSKSLDNIVYPENLVSQGFSWEQIRFYLLYRHYRKRLNVTPEAIREAAEKLESVQSAVREVLGGEGGAERSAGSGKKEALSGGLLAGFEAAMDDDLDVRAAFDSVHDAVSRLRDLGRAGRIDRREAPGIERDLRQIDRVLQVIFA